MKIEDLIEQFTIIPATHITPHFKLSKTLKMNSVNHKGCYNCGDDHHNQRILMSQAWTIVQWCTVCKHLNVVYESDPHGGGSFEDTIECFTERETIT